jgi:NADH oxidase (H2O-forming)
MKKAIVIFESTFGNTRSVAEKIAEGLKSKSSLEVEVTHIKKVDTRKLSKYDAILIGCPTHMGQPTRDTRNLVNKFSELDISGKTVAFFNCWGTPACEGKQVKMLEEISLTKAPEIKLFSPGLSVRVPGAKGPVSGEDFKKCVEFGKYFADRMN